MYDGLQIGDRWAIRPRAGGVRAFFHHLAANLQISIHKGAQ